jgi:hypothetical protein
MKLAAEVHLAQGQIIFERQTLNNDTSLNYRTRIRRPAVSEREGQNLEQKTGKRFVETVYFSA